jgi:hypothetical protein
MKNTHIFILITLLIAFSLKADERPTINSLIGQEFIIEDTWTGQSFTLKKKEKDLIIVWKVFGSGVPIVSEKEYPVKIKSDWQFRFHTGSGENINNFQVSILDKGKVKVYLNGIRIYAKNNKLLTKKSR